MSKKVAENVLQLVGRTPLVALSKYSAWRGLEKPIVAKVEYFNPGGSVKDRIALAMIEAAEASGELQPGGTIIEPTSGNTGVGLALVAAVKGYRLILTMPETMSVERRNLVKAYGAEVKLTGRHPCSRRVESYDSRQHHLGTVHQSGQSRAPLCHHRPRDLARHRRRSGYFCCRCRHRWHRFGCGEILERAKPSSEDCGC